MHKFVALTLVFSLILPVEAAADDCNPTAGDQMHNWVDKQASQISRQLAGADFDTRLFNYFMVSLDDIHQRMQDESAALVAMESRISASEASYAKQDPIQAAISRDAEAQNLLNNLFMVRSELDITKGRYDRLVTVPSHDEFELDGFGNVGRTTLMTSFFDLGSPAAHSLQAKFNISVSFTVNEDGDVTGGSVSPQGGMVDTVALALAYYAGPYGWCAFAAFELVKFGISQASCDDKIQHQKDRLKDAFQLLPSKLITDKEQFSLYSQDYSRWLGQFQPHIDHVQQALSLLDEQWKALLAYNVEREKVAQTVLTADKLVLVGQQYGVNEGMTSFLDQNVGIGELADNLGDLNSFLARKENALLQSCRSPMGLRTSEDYTDGLRYAEIAYNLLQKQVTLAPLSHFIGQSLDQISDERSEADSVTNALPDCSSFPLHLAKLHKEPQRLVAHTRAVTRFSMPLHLKARRRSLRSSGFVLFDLGLPADGPGWSFCTLVTTGGGTYDCQSTLGGGTSYDSGVLGADQNPYTGVLLAAPDGGYATDNRQISADIDAATTNLNQRISDLGRRSANAKTALPKWIADNEQAIATAIQASTASAQSIASEQVTFLSQNAAAIASAKSSIDAFVRSPYDRTAATVLLANVAGTDLSLPSIPASAVPPDMPSIVGVSAISRAYGDATGIERNILRETLKVNEQLANDLDLKSQALEDIEVARRFSSTQTPEAQRIVSALLDDAAALRYFSAGKLSKISYSTITPDGNLGRSETDLGQPLPKDAITQVISHFEGDLAVYSLKLAAAQSADQGGVVDSQQRQSLLQRATEMGSMAGSQLYEGESTEAFETLKVATALADVATAWVSGIDRGDLIYEAGETCSSEVWSHCGVAVESAIEGTDLPPGEIVALAGLWGVAYDSEFDALRGKNHIEESSSDADSIKEIVASQLNPFEIGKDKATDALIKRYLPSVAPVLEFTSSPFVLAFIEFFHASPTSDEYEELHLRDQQVQTAIFNKLGEYLQPDWKERLNSATQAADPELRAPITEPKIHKLK